MKLKEYYMEEIMNIPWGRMLLLAFFVYLFFIGLAWIYGKKILFPVPEPSYQKDDNIIQVQTSGDFNISLLRQGNTIKPAITIIYSHGNAEDIGQLAAFFEIWKEKDWEILAYDYPGYGLSDGLPSEEGCLQAIEAVYQYAIEDCRRSPEHILVWGRSLGTGPSCHLAARQKVAGLLLETPFLSAFRTVTEIPFLPWDYFNNLEQVKDIRCPSLIIHGELDEVVPFRHGKRLHKELPAPKTFLPFQDATHNNLESIGGEKYKAWIVEFIDNLATSRISIHGK
jgi:fermentation-respiration switch protein FrsA (DUF1100 family)